MISKTIYQTWNTQTLPDKLEKTSQQNETKNLLST